MVDLYERGKDCEERLECHVIEAGGGKCDERKGQEEVMQGDEQTSSRGKLTRQAEWKK